ncbi:probable cytochrome P450 9h1 [Drosophila nasuta]|uniref:probable cytochrome P450 9h1 n=1 Tax=Drosophila nasuta TaxID=42062 RepID=UPI00295F2B87|nr:probable cytochrome P450 9h1 [Drosophila nasuta]
MALIILALLLVLFVLLYKFSMAPYGVLSARGIAHEMPKPFIGNLSLRVIFARTPFIQVILDKYKKFKQHKVYGFYNVREPLFVLRDVEVIKKVGIQDFDYFTNHRPMLPESSGTIFSKCLISLNDDKWREMRNTLTPAFTGSKLKAMFELINECSLEGVRYIENELRNANSLDIELEMKDYFERFANDVIASAAFGIKVNSFVDKKNQFYKAGQSVIHFSGLAMIKIILYSIMPRVMKILPISMFDQRKLDYFKTLIFDAIKYRTENKIIRPDMIHLLMEAKRQFLLQETIPESSTEHAEFNDDDLLAQCVLFFFVGFEVMSACLSYLTYELCMNPTVQSKLYEEIQSVEQELQGKPLNYNMLSKMKYMELVISELLRLWPPAFSLDRVCGKDIDLLDDNQEVLVKFRKGDIIVIPVIALHRDPEHFPEPELFKPERFLEENKDEIKPFTYLPFGLGPRSCIGNRMALMEVKSIIYHMLCKFKLVPGEKTVKNVMDSLKGFHMQPKDKFWIKFVRRDVL